MDPPETDIEFGQGLIKLGQGLDPPGPDEELLAPDLLINSTEETETDHLCDLKEPSITSNPKEEETASSTDSSEVEMKKPQVEMDDLQPSLNRKDIMNENKPSNQGTTNHIVSVDTGIIDVTDSRNGLENTVDALLKQKESLQNEIAAMISSKRQTLKMINTTTSSENMDQSFWMMFITMISQVVVNTKTAARSTGCQLWHAL